MKDRTNNRIADFLIDRAEEARADYNIFIEIFRERSQAYGMLIQLMLDAEKTEVVYDYSKLRSSNKWILNFIPDEELKTLTLRLVENPEPEEETNE